MSKGSNLQKSKSANLQALGFEGWKQQIPETILKESFWSLIAYQKALYLYDLIWADTESWMRDLRGRELARQIIRSADSVCSNIEEGYGRGFGKELLYFYRVALRSARETKGIVIELRRFTPLNPSRNA
jgi:four helix bundle protein